MSKLLRGLEDFCLPYLDNMTIFSNSWEEYMWCLVLRKVNETKLKIKLLKFKFAQKIVKYLGYRVGEGFPQKLRSKQKPNFCPPKTKLKFVAY